MIQILNRRGQPHDNHCEDSFWLNETPHLIEGAILDGCSTGNKSHFASQMFAYLLEKSKREVHPEYDNSFGDGKIIFLTNELLKIREQIGITNFELLSTLVYFTYNKTTRMLSVKFYGDGTIFYKMNNVWIKFTHSEDNVPDYLSYHVDDSFNELQYYIDSRKNLILIGIDEFAICSDGIDSFRNIKNSHLSYDIPVDFLLNNDFGTQRLGLVKKFKILTNTDEMLKRNDELFYWTIKDDLTIVKYSQDAIIS